MFSNDDNLFQERIIVLFFIFQALERKSSFMSDATMESISGSETSTAPSSLQTIVRAPVVNTNGNGYGGQTGNGNNSHLQQSKTSNNNNNAETNQHQPAPTDTNQHNANQH